MIKEAAAVGGHIWYYFVPYQSDIQTALDTLREREFRAGRYNPVVPFPGFPVSGDYPATSAKHPSIKAAIEASGEDGTRSILDMNRVSDTPGYGIVSALPREILLDLYGTDKPTKDMVVTNMDFFEQIERGQGIYIFVFRGDKPSEILFAGYSFD